MMRIVDYIVGEDELINFSYVLVDDNEENVKTLKSMGCTDDEINGMRCHKDTYLDVFLPLHQKGYFFEPQKGFYKPTTHMDVV